MCASGAYYIAVAADDIYVDNASIVGSIGVISTSFGLEDFIDRHGIRRGLPHVLVEIRQDLIAAEADQRLWAARLAPMLAAAIAETEEPNDG